VSEVVVNGRRLPLSRALVQRVVRAVLRAERRDALMSVTFLGRDAMRRLNATHKGRDLPTDVLAFPLASPEGQTIGDVYICAWVARQEARARGREHPEGADRTRSAMWRRQERYLEALA
jgi:ssRNA-specific RNase YbeY (16S rRNA maturation enzyme)